MKKLLLSITAVVAGYAAYAQVVVAGVSPASIQGNYEFGVQANDGHWPGETDDATWGDWNGGLDFNNPGDFILDTLMLVEDGSMGLNPQGNPISQEGCNALTNDLTGKIAVVYRNTCFFSSKVYYAEQAGAVAVLVINREDATMGMLANTDPANGPLGVDCHIPAVIVSSIDGAAIVAEMQNGPVTMFIGNKLGAFNNDAGAVKGEFLIGHYGGAHTDQITGFDLGIQVYNYGLNNQSNVTINASIDGPSGNVYDEDVVVSLNSGDTAFVFPGNAEEFPAYAFAGGDGDYTLTYSIDLGTTDDFAFDNTYTADFKVQGEVISLARVDGNNQPVTNSYPSNSTTEYQSCMMVQESNFAASNLAVDGLWIVPHTDTAANDLAGAEIFVNAYQWDDGWVDLNDANYQFDPATNDAFQSLNLITFGTHYPASDAEVNVPVHVAFDNGFALQDNARYLFCAQTFESTIISFGYDAALDYGANYSIHAQPVSPVHVDGSWYAAGWNGVSAPAMALSVGYVGLEEAGTVEGSAFPNPAVDAVTVTVEANGAATLRVTDIAGKVAFQNQINIVNGEAKVDVSSLKSGVYVFNVTFENGETSQFNVVKK